MGIEAIDLDVPQRDTRLRCGVCNWEAMLPDDKRANYDSLKAVACDRDDPRLTIMRLFHESRDDGMPVQYAAFLKHVRGQCSGAR